MPVITSNEGADPGAVLQYFKVVPSSMRYMVIASPRTGQTRAGIYFEIEVPGGRAVMRMSTPPAGGKVFSVPEPFEVAAYRRLREKEEGGLRCVVDGEEKHA